MSAQNGENHETPERQVPRSSVEAVNYEFPRGEHEDSFDELLREEGEFAEELAFLDDPLICEEILADSLSEHSSRRSTSPNVIRPTPCGILPIRRVLEATFSLELQPIPATPPPSPVSPDYLMNITPDSHDAASDERGGGRNRINQGQALAFPLQYSFAYRHVEELIASLLREQRELYLRELELLFESLWNEVNLRILDANSRNVFSSHLNHILNVMFFDSQNHLDNLFQYCLNSLWHSFLSRC